MGRYLLKRILLIPPTLFSILFLNFILIQWAPGGPVERAIAEFQGLSGGSMSSSLVGGGFADTEIPQGEDAGLYRGSAGVPPKIVKEIEAMYGFDKPFWTRFYLMVGKYLRGDLGESYYKKQPVGKLIRDKLPVSISLGLWSTLLVYAVSLWLGIRKAQRHRSRFDSLTSIAVVVGYAVPAFLFGLLLIVLFAGGSYWSFFPLRGLVSSGAENWSWGMRILDYVWHMVLPLATQVLGGFASLTLLTKNAFLEEMQKPYVTLAYAKGLTEKRVLACHIFRNALLVLIVGFPQAFLHMFFTGSLLTEVLFSLDGIGYLGFQATLVRDYPVVFGTLFVFTLCSLIMHVVGDLLYAKVDPRMHFRREGD